ncbi:MFS transporter [Ochrobactrum sp. MYb15]|uniref:MFS transporter n=1 Tax=Brucella pituitosa TaxID=571256 RepID=UPI000CFCA555|nr:MFS transporter [Ochrobactrum sp. MYb19]PRA54461.1 MFS transporter [Ochrobactrum sp. MYb68]PRA64383.1 MFS transporter [Ochrobactrum sp. MYb18]PRA75107.1 MFS transporter [Brucella thiophenivorans]PRA89681.1 MFS transporter [Ochrobactrum sp. MYb14]PRA96712.1 MFS transporter [Ochrobactrum sp. MYb15]
MTDQTIARRNIFVLTAAQALGAASPPIIISLGGLVGQQLSSDPALVTLPVSLFSLGLALGTLPAAFIMRAFGRRNGYLLGAGFGMTAGLIAAFGIFTSSFIIFCLGTFIAGFYAAYVQSYRFAATDAATGALKARAISWVMVGGLIAAIIGPQLVIWTRDALPDTPYAGSFISQAALALLAIPVLLLFRSPKAAKAANTGDGGRSLKEILLSPRYILAVASGVVSYGLMTFVMTAAPIAMVGHGHSVDHAALGIQWHVLAMFGPSFFTGLLITRFGKERVTAVGLLIIALSAIVALSGLDLTHFWISLILLGIGWNFGFIGATAMVAECHTPEERGKAQGANDFLVFGTVACASFFAGSLLHSSGWQTINWLIFPAVALILVPLVWQSARKQRAKVAA